MYRLTCLVSSILTIFLLISCASVDVKPIVNAEKVVIGVPEYKAGDNWDYTNGYFKKVLGFENGLVITTSNLSKRCKNCKYYRDKNYTTVKVIDANGNPTEEPTGLKLLDFPLQVGKKWKQTITLRTISSGILSEYSNTFEILAYEEITVKAGSFKAFRIRWYQSQHGT